MCRAFGACATVMNGAPASEEPLSAGSDGLGGFGWGGYGGVEFVGFDVPGQVEEAQRGDAVPVGVDLVPGEAVAGGLWVGVVVVVPAFAEGEKRDPEAVA
jgi:hypothetical protein